MKNFSVKGMSCAACVQRVEKAVLSVDGVTSCSVNLLLGTLTVEGTADELSVIAAVKRAGYTADAEKTVNLNTEKPKRTIFLRLITSVILLAVLMYISMFHTMLGAPLPVFLTSPEVFATAEFLLSFAIIIINKKYFISGIKSALSLSPNMDTLVALGAGASFLYSCVILVMIFINPERGHTLIHELYFESAATILTLITVGKYLETRARGKTTTAIEKLIKLSPDTATVKRDGKEITVPVEKILVGDIFILRSGDSVPADGTVIDGSGTFDESMLTGESTPLDKTSGNKVISGTNLLHGYLECEATEIGEDTTLGKIVKTVADAAGSKAPIAKIADKIAYCFVPAVMSLAVIAFIVWMIIGESVGFSLARAISVLVISCPCALGLATPVAITVGTGKGASLGILYKTAVSLETAGQIHLVAFDKTGTLTKGKPKVTDVITDQVIEKFIGMVAAVEAKSEHPLSKAITEYAEKTGADILKAENIEVFPGGGISGNVGNEKIIIGNEKLTGGSSVFSKKAKRLCDDGKTPVFVNVDGETVGIIAISDQLKPESSKAVTELKKLGIGTVLLTGDNERTANAVKNETGIDEVYSGLLPEDKYEYIKSRQDKVAMVGDGINDAPALTAADIGIAIGDGTDIAIDSADIVIVGSNPESVPTAISLSRATLKNIRENLFWAFIYNILGIPVAAGVLIPVGITLNPMIAAAAMSLSSICVVMNALRLNLYKPYKKGNKMIMKKEIVIDGMMCPHCEARVKSALEKLNGVSDATVSHEKGTAIITLSEEISDETLKAVIEADDYKVISVNSI